MKYLLLPTMILSLSVGAETYWPNDKGSIKSSQKTRTGLEQQEANNDRGVFNGSGVTTQEMNTSSNTPPATEEELLDDSTLSTGRFHPTRPGEIQAQESEDAFDYSTTPEKRMDKTLEK